ncbi:ABC transporter ATP-binding protein [Rhizobium sp. R693]|uniref:ABC transporter ATP-binding protein n=1 Tax=Rhizobium sp. R693 TaxID=1764276 RepID=UPI000B52A70B|nr:ABC transporter ATP-binding protein [Rhizobium sp. R693]OWV96818.1 ABC transporter [Rhizobium sp. R693]
MRKHLLLENVGVQRGRATVLSGITASVAAGQIVGLVGPNGTGKSTLLNAIAGLVPHSGTITWGGDRLDIREVGLMPQQCAVRAELTALEVVLLGRHERLGWQIDEDALNFAAAILQSFGIADLAGRRMLTLSGGQQQLVLLAQRLLREPKLLLLDEATSALDIRHQMHVLRLLRDYVARTGALVLIAIHDLNLAARYSDTVLLLHSGRVAGSGAFDAAVTPQTLRSVYGIEAEFLVSRSGTRLIVPLSSCALASD